MKLGKYRFSKSIWFCDINLMLRKEDKRFLSNTGYETCADSNIVSGCSETYFQFYFMNFPGGGGCSSPVPTNSFQGPRVWNLVCVFLRRLRKKLYFKALLFHHCPNPSSKECIGIIQNLNHKFSFIYCMYSHKSKKGLKNYIKPMCRKLLYISNIIKFIADITEVGMFMNYIFISCILYMYI